MVLIKARKANVICTNHEIDPPRFQLAQTYFFFALDKTCRPSFRKFWKFHKRWRCDLIKFFRNTVNQTINAPWSRLHFI